MKGEFKTYGKRNEVRQEIVRGGGEVSVRSGVGPS